MSNSAAHLRLVSTDDDVRSHEEIARQFRETMTEHIRAHTDGTNVNNKTLLATDYLNHFNEAIMLLEMLPGAPAELAADLAKWQHESYEEHFHHSGFRDKGLAIAGYNNAPEDIRSAFDSVISEISGQLSSLLMEVQRGIDSGDMNKVTALCAENVPLLQSKVEKASAIVNGEITSETPAATDDATTDAGAHQAAVDALFD